MQERKKRPNYPSPAGMKRITLDLPVEMMEAIRVEAFRRNVPRMWVIRDAIKNHFSKPV